jgi:hypothetical protein
MCVHDLPEYENNEMGLNCSYGNKQNTTIKQRFLAENRFFKSVISQEESKR